MNKSKRKNKNGPSRMAVLLYTRVPSKLGTPFQGHFFPAKNQLLRTGLPMLPQNNITSPQETRHPLSRAQKVISKTAPSLPTRFSQPWSPSLPSRAPRSCPAQCSWPFRGRPCRARRSATCNQQNRRRENRVRGSTLRFPAKGLTFSGPNGKPHNTLKSQKAKGTAGSHQVNVQPLKVLCFVLVGLANTQIRHLAKNRHAPTCISWRIQILACIHSFVYLSIYLSYLIQSHLSIVRKGIRDCPCDWALYHC